MKIPRAILQIRPIRYFAAGRRLLEDPHTLEANKKNRTEIDKPHKRHEVINFILSKCSGPTRYLEIGVRNPAENFDLIHASEKYSVDPGVEFSSNPVDFAYTSNEFFEKLDAGRILDPSIRFDAIFIDGLHLAEQVDQDIKNSLRYLKDSGYIILHDCNPPTEWHARETYRFYSTPAGGLWNGTTWKAFVKWRFNPEIYSCCVDSDWGLGVISTKKPIGKSISKENEFFEFAKFDEKRSYFLNLLTFEDFQNILQ